MERLAITAFKQISTPLVDLTKSGVETLAMLALGMIWAQTTHLARLSGSRSP